MSAYSDLVSGHTRTWPYGTKKHVEIISYDMPDDPMMKTLPIIVAKDHNSGEGFLLIGDKGADESKVGDLGTITFTQGGPLGGYWKFEKYP